jgi:hypothetical protein
MAPAKDDASSDATVVPIRPVNRHVIVRQWPIALVLLGVAVACAMIAMDSFRRGCVVLSASVLLAAFLRLLLSDADAGLLVVRTRRLDVAILLVLGLGLAVFSLWVPPPS